MEELGGIVRTLIATGAGSLLAQGIVTQDQVTAISAGVTALIVAAWSVYQKRKAKAVK